MTEHTMEPHEELNRNLKLAEEWSGTFKILGDQTRLKLLSSIHFAGQFQYTVSELAEATEVRVATASAALRAMELNGTVKSQRDGRSIRYGISDENVHDLLHWIGAGHRD
ncbi:ArsR/SmtB family transcription factor [Corynebacterium cystitidis]|uniref:ArsR/SmtB family transcription factor n=1 Tax=Corynebacterium cystitidis TaxID=35757 RepID=UPI00211E71C2|nr:metalloregulator ArsR/SmtB family transcription factor [Corynebacterium cystitidis]